MLQTITLACAHSVSATLGLPSLTAHVPSLPTVLRLYVAPQGTVRGRSWAARGPGLSRSGSGTQVVLRGTDSVGPAFCALPRSEQLR